MSFSATSPEPDANSDNTTNAAFRRVTLDTATSSASGAIATDFAPGRRHIIFLGTGTSTGVPMLGCDCFVCRSEDLRNKRLRPSVLFRFPGGDLLIDTTPELRLQLLRLGISHTNAIAYTHDHADHLFGLDDARVFPRHTGGAVPIYCEPYVEASIRRIFHYAFHEEYIHFPAGGVPKIVFQPIAAGTPFAALGETVMPIRLDHGRSFVMGFRVGGLAYCTDVKRIPDESWPLLQGLDTLILGALRQEQHPTHLSVPEALTLIERLAPKRAYLTHLSHGIDHAACEQRLPANVRLAYDGLTLAF